MKSVFVVIPMTGLLLAVLPLNAWALQMEPPIGAQADRPMGNNPNSRPLIETLIKNGWGEFPKTVADGDGSCACPDGSCVHTLTIYSNELCFEMTYVFVIPSFDMRVPVTIYFWNDADAMKAVAHYPNVTANVVGHWVSTYGYPPGHHPEAKAHVCGKYLHAATVKYIGHLDLSDVQVSGHKEKSSTTGISFNLGFGGSRSTEEKSDSGKPGRVATGKTVGSSKSVGFGLTYEWSEKESSDYVYKIGISWNPNGRTENRQDCSCGSTDKPESGLQNPDPTKTVQDPSPFGKSEVAILVLPDGQEQKVRSTVDKAFGVNEVVIPIISDDPVVISTPDDGFGVATAQVLVIADETTMKQADHPIQKKVDGDKQMLVVDPLNIKELTTITSSGDAKNRQNRWQRLKLVKVDSLPSAHKETGFITARNPNDDGNAPLNFSPQVSGTARIAFDVDASALEKVARLDLLDPDQKPLASYKPDLVVRQGATATTVGAFEFADPAAFDRFTTLKAAPALLVTRKDGTSTSLPITDIARKDVLTSKETPRLSANLVGADVKVTAVSEAREVERRQGRLPNTVRTIVEQVNPDGSVTVLISTLKDGTHEMTVKAPQPGTVFKTQGYYVGDEPAERAAAEDATREMKKITGDNPAFTDYVPAVRP